MLVNPWIREILLNKTPVIEPVPLNVPFTWILLPQELLFKIVQSVVALNLKVNRANTSFGVVGNGKSPKSQTIEPVAPRFGLNVIALGVGSGVKNTLPEAVLGT